MKFELTVPPEAGGETLLSFLRAHLKEFPSVKAVKRAIDQKQCTINGRVEWFSTYRVRTGDKVTISLQPKKKAPPPTILFEDESLIALDKPAGRTSESFTDYLLVHRLDKDTSGVFLMAKTEAMRDQLSKLFAQRKMKKSYLALCDGKGKGEKWKVDNFLGKVGGYQGGVLFGPVSKEKGRRAVTTFTLLKKGKTASLILAEPLTGKTHQIRIHLKLSGCPVLGDWQYNRQFTCSYHPPRQMLHAHCLAFIHPGTEEKISLEAPIPKDFLETQKIVITG